jgi:hypothetical protein
LDELQSTNFKLLLANISIKDLPLESQDSLLIAGEEYVPPIELALNTQCYSIFTCLIEMYNQAILAKKPLALRVLDDNYLEVGRDRELVAEYQTYLSRLRERAEESDMYEIIDILNDFEEDKEIAEITNYGTDFQQNYLESLKILKSSNVTTVLSSNNNNNNTKLLNLNYLLTSGESSAGGVYQQQKKPAAPSNTISDRRKPSHLDVAHTNLRERTISNSRMVKTSQKLSRQNNSNMQHSKLCSIL